MEKDAIKYRPFETCGEFVSERAKHAPCGFIKSKGYDGAMVKVSHIAYTNMKGKNMISIFCCHERKYSFEEAFKKYTFADGTPFGVLLAPSQSIELTAHENKKERMSLDELLPKVILTTSFLAMCVSVSWSAFCESFECGLFISGMFALIFGLTLPLIIDGGNNTSKNKETK